MPNRFRFFKGRVRLDLATRTQRKATGPKHLLECRFWWGSDSGSTRGQFRAVNGGMTLPRHTESFPVFHGGIEIIVRVRERALNGGLEPLLVILQCRVPFRGQGIDQIAEERLQATHHLHALGAIGANLINGEAQKVLPCGNLTH